VPLLRLHQHTHYSYLASLATAATHGVLLTTLADLWREKWPVAKFIETPQATKGGPGKPPAPKGERDG